MDEKFDHGAPGQPDHRHWRIKDNEHVQLQAIFPSADRNLLMARR